MIETFLIHADCFRYLGWEERADISTIDYL